jgi:ABC-type Zn uptake system ZnuABC Zn-binding protein ZnuA
MDPTLVAGWTVEIAEALAEVDPEHAAEYAARAASLSDELHELDEWIRSQVSAVPAPRRVLVTDHDVLSYFADRYGFELLETIVPGVSTASEPSARHLAQLRETIAEHDIPAIFIGTTVSPQMAQSVADDLDIELVAIYTGSLSEPDGPAATYQDFMRTNVERIVAALAP